ncbi:MAG: hypothetical protein V1794_11855 [Candidatus Glassbacteria bacterium]
MIMRMIREVTFAAILALTISCSKGDPFSPETDSGANQSAQAERLLPLAAGDKWQYRLTFSRSSHGCSSCGGSSSEYYGTFEFSIPAKLDQKDYSTFFVETRLKVDTLHHYEYDDETYEQSSYDEFNVIDTTMHYIIRAARDTLWYVDNGALSLMLANDYPEKGEADLRIFSCPPLTDRYMPGRGNFWKTDFVFDSISGRPAYRYRQEGEPINYILYYYQKIEPQGELMADFYKPIRDIKTIPGFTSVHWYRHEGGSISYSHEELTLSILSYVSGDITGN